MAFVTKVWKDRLVEYAGRRKLKNVATGAEALYDVTRSEGTVSQAGDAFSASNMNNLEQRIKNEFDTVNNSLGGNILTYEDGKYYIQAGADSVRKKLGSAPLEIILTLSPKTGNEGGYTGTKYSQSSNVNIVNSGWDTLTTYKYEVYETVGMKFDGVQKDLSVTSQVFDISNVTEILFYCPISSSSTTNRTRIYALLE